VSSSAHAKPHRALRVAAPLVLAVAAAGCFDSGSSTSPASQPTLVVVEPEFFLGSVACLDTPGAARRYVTTIYDVTPPPSDDAGADGAAGSAGIADAAPGDAADAGDAGDDASAAQSPATDAGSGFPLPSSKPVSCTQRAGSSLVVAGRRYSADVQIFDRIDITPLGAGSPVMVDAQGVFVPPRWTTSCGRGSGEAATAYAHVTRVLADCDPLTDSLGPGPTTGTVTIALDPAAASLTCGNAPGEVALVRVSLAGSTDVEGVCGQPLGFEGLASGQTVVASVLAFESGSTIARWGTRCTATVRPGIAVTASCDPLRDGGTLRFDVAALATSAGRDCLAELSSVSVVSRDGTITRDFTPPTCTSPLRLDGIPTGDYTFDLTTTLVGGGAGPAALCTASAVPATATTATCQLVQ
jgi:hypothetical protein